MSAKRRRLGAALAVVWVVPLLVVTSAGGPASAEQPPNDRVAPSESVAPSGVEEPIPPGALTPAEPATERPKGWSAPADEPLAEVPSHAGLDRSAAPDDPGTPPEDGDAGDPPIDEVIVFLEQPGPPDARRLSEVAGVPLDVAEGVSDTTWVLRLPEPLPEARLEEVLRRLESLEDVAGAEPNGVAKAVSVPDDPYYKWQWHLAPPAAGEVGANFPGAWDITTGSSVVRVAVLDTGSLSHADTVGMYAGGYDFVSDVATANDGNGRDPDPSDPGDWVTAAESASGRFEDCRVKASSWHGLHVAGTVGARSNNAKGVTGANWVSQVVPVRVLGKCGGGDADIAAGIRWAAGLSVPGAPSNPLPAKVLNLSLGGEGACPQVYQDAIDDALAASAVVVVAAGNEKDEAANHTPANCSGVITVGATNRYGDRATYSNFGSGVDLSAPGGDLLSGDRVWSTLNSGTTSPAGDAYAAYQGTSMATPHVTGAVSLMASVRGGLTPGEALSLLQRTSTPISGGNLCVSGCGWGVLNAQAAVSAARPTANDAFSAAIPIPPGGPSPMGANNFDASKQTGEPAHAGSAGGRSVWWTFTAPSNGTVTLSTQRASFDTTLAVYTGTSVGSLSLVTGNDDAVSSERWSRVSFSATAGVTYRVAVDGYGGASGWIPLHHWYTPTSPPGGRFVGTTPTRLLDSRNGTGGYSTPWSAGQTRTVTVRGGATPVPPDATAVVLNVTATQPTGSSYLTVYPSGASRPLASNLNFVGGQTVANLVTVAVGTGNSVSVYNYGGTVHAVADVVGYYSPSEPAGRFVGTTPTRVYDSRSPSPSPWGPGETWCVKVRGPSTPTPENATAVVVNVTATQASAASYLTVYPSGSARPLASNLNFPAGGTVPNLVVSRIGTDGRVCIYNYAGSVHVILDIVGFFTVEGAGSRFVGITPYRRYDSRSTSSWGPDQSYWLTVRGGGLPVPANATAVVMNVTVTQPTATGYLTVHPSQQPRPTASNLNFTPGRTVPNLVTVKIGSNGGVDVYNSAGNTHVVLDIVGYYL